jgi:hypothetical protein
MKTRGFIHTPTSLRVAAVATGWSLGVAGLPIASATTVGYWRFEEGTNGAPARGAASVLDTSGLGQHGTPENEPVYTNAVPVVRVAQTVQTNTLSLSFDGVDDLVTIPHSAALGMTNAFTVEFWMRSSGNGQRQCLLVDKSHGFTDNTGWLFQSGFANGIIFFGVGLGGGDPYSNFQGVFSRSDLFDGQWHHLAGTYDGLTVEFFVDGVSQGTNAVGAYVGNTRAIRIGNTRQLSRYLAGEIDELRISHAVLKPGQLLNVLPGFSISALASGGRRVSVNALVGCRYTLERRASLTDGEWAPVVGQTDVLCTETGPLALTDAETLPQTFYRVVATP